MRISVSNNRNRIIFDTLASTTSSRTRYSYSLTRGHVDRFQNISQVLGNKVESISALAPEGDGQQKMQVTSDKGTGLIYFSSIVGAVARITEDGAYRVTESFISLPLEYVRLTEISGTSYDISLVDLATDTRPPYKLDASNNNYAVEEGDVNYGIIFEDGES